MNGKPHIEKVKALAEIVRHVSDSLAFTLLEIGAVPLEGNPEPFHVLLDSFPGSQVIAFEVDVTLCDDLNRQARPGLKFHPVTLGKTEEERPFYLTRDPMCCSLYRPNEELLGLYHNMEVATLTSQDVIRTVSLDNFARQHGLDDVDFIKIDIQGAELDVFEGGVETLAHVVAIVSEVEFIPHYIDQPLFGDVCAFLADQDIMFHKFLGVGGRALKPVVIANNPNFPSQHIWSDAVFIRHVTKIPDLPSDKLLKLGMLSFIYGSPDLAFYCFRHYDERHGTQIIQELPKIEQ
jgi:FkbM family methyltransferase